MTCKVLELAPELALILREWRKCRGRVVRCLAEAGVRQFIDIADRLPTQPNVHEVAPTRAEVECFFDGLELVEPGLVCMTEWRPEPGAVIEKPEMMWAVAGVGRKR